MTAWKFDAVERPGGQIFVTNDTEVTDVYTWLGTGTEMNKVAGELVGQNADFYAIAAYWIEDDQGNRTYPPGSLVAVPINAPVGAQY